MRSLSSKEVKGLSVYAGAVLTAATFWVFESLMKGSLQPDTSWSELFIPSAPAELWFRIFTGAIIVSLVIGHQERTKKIRGLEEQLSSGQ